MFCKSCFRQLPEGARFCGYCGKPVETPVQPGQTQQEFAQTQQSYPQRQDYPQQVGEQQGYGQPLQAYPPQESMTPKQTLSLMAQIKAGVMDIIRHPARLLPTIILMVLWMVISLLMAMGKDLTVVKWLNTLTYASGGMYGGALGAAGGIFGKAIFAAVLNTVVLSLWFGKNPFARDPNGESLMRQAAASGMATVAPFLIGLGASLMLYYFFNVTGSTNNVMVGVMAAIGAMQAAQSSHGIIFSIVFFITGKASGGRAPSGTAVRNSLLGATVGFALAVPLTFLHQPLLLASAGTAVLLLGILLSVMGQKRPAQV